MKIKTIRKENRNKIRKAFKQMDQMTSAEIAKIATLSVVTVNTILMEMVQDGEVEVLKKRAIKGGRPSACYKYNYKFICGCAVYAYDEDNGITFHIAVFDIFGNNIEYISKKEKTLERHLVLELFTKVAEKYPTIKVLTLGLPGYETEQEIIPADFAGLFHTIFLEELKNKYQWKILFMNDVNAAVYGHYHMVLNSVTNEVGIYFPKNYPPGAGLVLDNKLYTGTGGLAGEVGNIPVPFAWEQLFQYGEEKITQQIKGLLMSIICIVAPERIVLYGEYLNSGIVKKLQKDLAQVYGKYYKPELEYRLDFNEDFRNGLIYYTKNYLEKEYKKII